MRRGMALRVSASHDASFVRLGVPEVHPSMLTGVGHVDEVLNNGIGALPASSALSQKQNGGGSRPKSAVSTDAPDC